MTEKDVTEEDFENFDEKTQEEKLETLQRLHSELAEGEGSQGLLQNVDLEGELTVRVFDDDGEEKQVEKQEFKA